MRNSVKKWGVGIAVFAAIVTTAVLLPQDKVTDSMRNMKEQI